MTAAIIVGALIPVVLLISKRARFSHVDHFVDLISTFWHEMSHAITASVLRGEVDAIRLEPGRTVRAERGLESFVYAESSSGVTHYRTTGNPFVRFLITGAGYAGPTILALLMAASWHYFGLFAFGVIWSILLVVFLLVSRGVYALLINLVSLAMVAVTVLPESMREQYEVLPYLQVFLPSALISALVCYGFKDALANFRSMRRIHRGELPATGDSDTEKMAMMTGVPATFWSTGYVVLSMFGMIAIPSLLIWQN